MSFNDEYLKLRKKRLEEQASRGATERKTQSNGSRPVMLNTLTPQANSDIAPVRQTPQEQQMASNDERKWFQKGAFEDGYQFGDLTKTIISSSKDLETNVLGGILGIGEKVVDAGAYLVGGIGGLFSKDFKDNVGSFIEKDLYDEEAVARKIVSGRTLLARFGEGVMDEENSVFGEKTDALAQSGGQLLGTIGLQAVGVPWFVTSGVTSFGSEAENALNQGATYGQAGLSAAINAGVEIATEKLFGGSGLGEKGLINLDGLTKGISNKVGKALLDFGIDMTAEGMEEIASQIGSNFASALYSEKNLQELLLSEEAFDEYLESFIGGMALGGFANVGKVGNSIKTGRDYRTGLTESEQKVFDRVYNDAIAKKEEGGKELSKKEKAELYDAVMRDLEKGGIDIDTIEEVLGDDAYKSYKDTIDYEDDILKQFEELGNKTNPTLADQSRYTELQSKIAEINQTSQRDALKNRLSEEVFGKVKDTKLAESYNERARRGQVFEADLSQYDEKQQEVIKRAVESGVLNNTNRTHEFVDLIAKISADKGVLFDFTNNKKLKESGFAVDGAEVNGFVTKYGISINIDSHKALQSTVGHEITHVLEGTELYAEMQRALFDYAKSRNDYQGRYDSLSKLYEGIEGADIDAELTADLVGDYLFTDEDFVKHLSTQNRNVFQKMYDEIKYLWKLATAGSKEARELEKVKRAFDKAYKESGKVDTKSEDFYDAKAKYSLTVKDAETLDFLNNQETITTYKTMQLVDGKLYPPMAARTDGKYEDASELGVWEQATEHPELIKNGNKFKLDKGKGQGSIEAAYNPYMHSSNLVLNDQFSGAYKRDNLVTVECEVPVSELTSGYHAEFAKDSVGWHPWHTGTVAGQLRQARGTERQVFLSRWIKPVRIVPDSEVAAMYKELLDGTDVEVPDNVVTPSLLNELKNAGVKIKESGRVKYSISDKNIKDVSTGYASGESYYTMSYTQDGKVVGTLEYGEYDGAPNVKMIEVEPEYRRKGIATKLMQELQKKYPDAEIDFGMSTPDGTKLLDAITYDVTDEAVVADRQKLKTLQTELNDLQGKLDTLFELIDNGKDLTEAQDTELHELGDRWQETYETIRELEKSLQGKRATKTFVKTPAKYSISGRDGNGAEFNGKPFWSGSVNLLDGVVEEVHSYQEAESADFHHSLYFSQAQAEKIDNGENGFFFVDNGKVYGEWRENVPQDIIKQIERQITKYSLSDSDGKKLTKEQNEYFKDSKMRDENGNLKVMYHGSQDAGFHTFDASMSDDDTSFFFVDRNDVAASYSGTTETYEAQTIRTAEDMNKFIESIGVEGYEVVEKDGKFTLLYEGDRVADSNTAQGIYDEFCWYEGVGEGDANYKVYLNLTNPLEIDAKGRPWNKIDAEFSQEVYDRYKSLTAEEKAALTDLAEWEDFRIFNSEIQEAKGNELASAYAKMGEDVNIYDLFSAAADGFSEEAIRENSRYYLKTRDFAQRAKEQGYDGVIFKNIIDNGGYSNGDEGASTVAIAFDSNQIKSVANESPTRNADIRYSLSDIEGKPIDADRISIDESDTRYSLSHNSEIAKGQMDYIANHKVALSQEELAEAQKVTNAMVDVMMKYSSILPEDKIGKVLTKNGSYDRSVENTTICVRTLAYNEFVDKVQEEVGRPLTQMESFLVSQKLYDIAVDPQCLYCYVSLDRKAFNDMLLRYMQDRDTVIAKYNNSDKSDATVGKLYEEFLNGRKDTKNMKDRFNKWLSYVDDGTQLLSLADIATEDRQSVIKANGGNLAAQLADARAYAQSASWSKIQKNYVAYRDEILKLGDRVVKNLNEHYGLRWYSFSDYSAAFIVENMQQITDASIRGLKGLSYTKDTDYAEIFAPSGMNINVSVFVNQDANGNFFIDEKQSANFEKALELRERYPNVGIVATVTNDDALRWAASQEWSDVIIPFHIVRTGADVAEYYKWLNYTAESADSVKDSDLWNAYLDSLNLSDGARKKASKNIYPNEHKNDKNTYLNLCESRGLTPRFARFAGEDWYMKLVNETRLSADVSTPLKPTYNLEAAQASFQKFVEKGGYEGGWYKKAINVDAEAKAVAQDVLAGKKANEVDYGRQDAFVPEDLMAGRRTNRVHGKYSLSPEGEPQKRYGNYNIYGKDVRFEAPMQEQVAPVFAPIPEAEANAMQSENIAHLDDADAPPEMDMPIVESERQSLTLDNNAAKRITNDVNNLLGLDAEDTVKMEKTIQKYAQNPNMTDSELFEEIRQEYKYTVEMEADDDLTTQAKQYMRRMHLYVPADLKGDFDGKRKDGFNQFRKEHFGHFYLTTAEGTNAIGIDQAYQELLEMFPGVFPEDVWNAADQLQIMGEVADYKAEAIIDAVEYDGDTIQEVCDIIKNGVDQYSQESTLRLAEEARTSMFASDDFAPVKEKYEAIRPERKKNTEPRLKRVKDADDVAPTESKTAEIYDTEPETRKKKSRGWARFRANFLDKQSVFEDLALKTNNRELMGKANYILSAEQRAQRLIGKGKNDAGVKSLNDIRAEVESTGKTKQFYEYLYHKHNIDRMSLETPKPVFGDSVTADVSRAEVAKYEAANPKFKEYAQDVYDYMNYLRDQMVESGVISQETADLWAQMYPHYVPVRRLGDTGLNINVPLDTGRTGVNAPIKKATGGSRDILPLFDTMALRTEQTYKAIAKNNFGVELKNTLGSTIESADANLDEMIDSVDAHEELLKKGENGRNPTFTVFEDGKKVTFEITEDMYDALKPTSDDLRYTNKVANTIGNIHRGLLTEYNPTFMLTNAIKDAQDILINSQHPAKTYANLPNAITQMATNGAWYQEYLENGGESNTYFDGQSNTFTKDDTGIKKIIGMPLRAISALNNYVERAPRLAEYIASRKAGASAEVAMLDAARVTTNFAAGGDVTKFANRNGFTFLNASVQGAMQQVRNVREAKANGLKGWVQLATKVALAGIPAMILNNLLWDDDEEYEQLSDYVKDNYYVVAKFGDGQFVRIPKGRAMAVIQDALEQVGNALTGDDEVDLANFLELAISNLAPNNPLDNNILAPIGQVMSNKTWYGDDLVPTRLQDLPAAEQFDESTDSISKWLGEKLNISPYKINYLLNQYSGGVGDVVLPMLTPEAESGDNSLAGNLIAPMKDKFTTDSVMNNQNVSDFYDAVDKLAANAKSSYATDEDILKYKYMNSVNAELSELYKKKREIQNSNIADKYKYEAVREVQKRIDELAEESLNTYGNVLIDDGYAVVGDRYYRLNDKGEWVKITDKQLDKQEEVTSGLGINPAAYWENKSEYDFAYEHPGKYGIAKSVGGYESYKTYTSDLYDIKADKDENGKSIVGSRKQKVANYINNLDIPYAEKIILFKSEYKADDTYNAAIVQYLNNRNDISYEEMVAILQELGFTVKGNTVTWD